MTLTKEQSRFILANYLLGYLFIYPLFLAIMTSFFHSIGIMWLDSVFEIGIYVITFSINFWFARTLLKEAWLNFIANWQAVLVSSVKWYCLLWVVMIGMNLILISITHLNTSENQLVLMQQITQNPVKIILLSCVFAPFVEEVVFRGALYQSMTAKRGPLLGLLISSVLFGLLHVFSSLLTGNWADCAYILIYGTMGIILCLASRNNKTLASSIMIHGMNNLYSVILMLL